MDSTLRSLPGRTLIASANGPYRSVQAAVTGARNPSAANPWFVWDLTQRRPGLLEGYSGQDGIHVAPGYTGSNLVLLEKGGTYDTLKKARDAAGDDGVIYCIADATVSPEAGTPLQDAITAASAGDIIYVEDGTYEEASASIDKDLTLIGAGRTQTIIINQPSFGSATTEVIGVAALSMGQPVAGNSSFAMCGELYLVDCYAADSENGIGIYSQIVLEAWNTEFETAACGAISDYSASPSSITLHHCWLHNDADTNALNAGVLKNIGAGSTVRCYDCKFSRGVVDITAPTSVVPAVYSQGVGNDILLERCWIVSDISATPTITEDVLVSPNGDDITPSTITLIDCYFESIRPAGATVTHIKHRTNGTTRYARCSASEDLIVGAGAVELIKVCA